MARGKFIHLFHIGPQVLSMKTQLHWSCIGHFLPIDSSNCVHQLSQASVLHEGLFHMDKWRSMSGQALHHPLIFFNFPNPHNPKCLHDRLYNMGRNLRKDVEHSAMESSLCWFRVVWITSSGWGTLFELLPKLVLVLVERQYTHFQGQNYFWFHSHPPLHHSCYWHSTINFFLFSSPSSRESIIC